MLIEKYSAIYKSRLAALYPPGEVSAITDLVFSFILKSNRLQLSLIKKENISGSAQAKLEEILNRLITGEPVQYVLGETIFYGCRISVNPSVLIPRPETEVLVDLVVKENPQPGLRILDICTGSGCIAIALQKNLKNAKVEGLDISETALTTAAQNAVENNCQVDFFLYDLLGRTDKQLIGKYDILISNPPYVTNAEKTAMHRNVTDFEPHLALFVPDDDPLVFYRAIGNMAKQNLLKNGKIYFEVNESFANELAIYFTSLGYHNVHIKKDLHGKQRFLVLS